MIRHLVVGGHGSGRRWVDAGRLAGHGLSNAVQ